MRIAFLKNLIASESHESILAREAAGSFIIKIVGAGLAFGVQILLARLLGSDQFGIFAYILTWILLLLLIGKLGIDTALLKYVSAYRANKQWGLLKGVLHEGHRISLTASFSVAVLGGIVVYFLGDRISADQRITAWIGCAVIPVMSLIQIRQSIVRSLQKVTKAILPELVIQPLIFGLLVAAGWFINKNLDAATAMTFNLVAFLIGLVIITFWMNQLLDVEVRSAKIEKKTREWITVALPLLMMSGFNLLNSQLNIILVGFFRGTTESGYYFAAVRLSTFLIWGLQAVNLIAAPLISQLYSQNKHAELQKIASFAALGIAIFTFPAAALILILGKFFLGCFQPEFVVAYVPMVFLVIGQCVNALAGSVGYLMTMTKLQNQAAYIIGVSALVNLILNVILIPRFGLTGAAVSTMITTILWNVSMYIIVRKKLRIDPSLIGLFAPVKNFEGSTDETRR